jgi:uncharacterized RDD family membrane protein YckC
MRYAGFWSRLYAGFIDYLILAPFVFVFDYLHFSLSWTLAIILLLPLGLLFQLYDIYFIGIKGQTPGKMVAGIKVIPMDGSTISLKHGFYRNSIGLLLGIISIAVSIYTLMLIEPNVYNSMDFNNKMALIIEKTPSWNLTLTYFYWAWYLSELVVLLFNKKKRALHDYIAGTVVIHVVKPRQSIETPNDAI